MPATYTFGALAERLGLSHSRLRYLLDSRQIAASARAGRYRLFTEQDVERVRQALAEADAHRPAIRAVAPPPLIRS